MPAPSSRIWRNTSPLAINECIAETQWQALSAAASSKGGVGFYVYDVAANTIRLPDLRGDSFYAGDVAGKW